MVTMGVFPFQGKTHMVEPGIEPGTSWLVVRNSDHQAMRLVTEFLNTRVVTLIVATIYLQLIQNRYMFRSFTIFIVVTSIVYNPLPAMWKS